MPSWLGIMPGATSGVTHQSKLLPQCVYGLNLAVSAGHWHGSRQSDPVTRLLGHVVTMVLTPHERPCISATLGTCGSAVFRASRHHVPMVCFKTQSALIQHPLQKLCIFSQQVSCQNVCSIKKMQVKKRQKHALMLCITHQNKHK